jgi:asparagine synthase (glutamine-hydrolysing)
MCGIAGVVAVDSRVVEPAVRSMMRAMVHRGPDDEGYAERPVACDLHGAGPPAGVVGLGFRRLAILDLSPAGHQPMIHPHTGDCLVFNGEIYNFRWLRAKVEALGVRVRSSGDTEVLLHTLAAWGEKALDEIDGMFSFAFYHAQSRRVLLARDPYGIKPLYVACGRHALVFASEVRAVLASGLVADDLDPAGVAGFLAYGAPQDPLTVHRAVRSFPNGTCAWIGSDAATRGPRERRYWRFPECRGPIEEAEAVRTIQRQLNASVRDQCISDVPLGVFLSGGVDSATLAALARRHASPLRTYAVGYESADGQDELTDAAATARALGLVHQQTILDEDWVMLQWREWLRAADRPSIDGLNTFVVSGVVKDSGATVALSGLGADELFGGYPTFQRAAMAQRFLRPWWFVPRRVRRAAARLVCAALPSGQREKATDLLAGGTTALELASQFRRLTSDAGMRSLGFDAGSLGLTPQFLPPAAFAPFEDTQRDPFRAVSQAECFLYMGNTLLRDADTNSMAHSLEIRVPFLGRWLADGVAGLPGSVKQPQPAERKYLLRRAMEATLPADLFVRPKRGFSLPIGAWMVGKLRDECEAAVATLAKCPLFPAGAIDRLWRDYSSRRPAMHWSRPLSLVVLGRYLQQARDRVSQSRVETGPLRR